MGFGHMNYLPLSAYNARPRIGLDCVGHSIASAVLKYKSMISYETSINENNAVLQLLWENAS